MLAFVFGDYLAEILPWGPDMNGLYAALAVFAVTAMNIMGTQKGKWTQNLLTGFKVIGLLSIIGVGIIFSPSTPPTASAGVPSEASFGLAMVFVLLTFGGWNEAAYISSELNGVRRNMVHALLWGVGIITVIYLLINLAYLKGLGLKEMSETEVVAAALMNRAFGQTGDRFISLLIVISALGGINACVFTGGRTSYALGRDFSLFRFLGHWHGRSNTPIHALLFQGAISLVLIWLGTLTRTGFVTMVEYTAPVFWLFLLLVGISLFVLRFRDNGLPRPFRVPFYPLTPFLFCVACIYMFHSSVAYTRVGGLVGMAVLLAGALLLLIPPSRRQKREEPGISMGGRLNP
jgi:amino acid transporter